MSILDVQSVINDLNIPNLLKIKFKEYIHDHSRNNCNVDVYGTYKLELCKNYNELGFIIRSPSINLYVVHIKIIDSADLETRASLHSFNNRVMTVEDILNYGA